MSDNYRFNVGVLSQFLGEHNTIDKSDWPRGPWLKEPDVVVGRYRGFWYLIYRAAWNGVLNGYVYIHPNHPWFGYDWRNYDRNRPSVDPHGGWTLTEPTEDGWWVLGFDTGHFGDWMPNAQNYGGTYRTIEYVHEELIRLIRAAHEDQKRAN